MDPEEFSEMIEQQDKRLDGFFNEMVGAIVPSGRKEKNKDDAKRSIVARDVPMRMSCTSCAHNF